MWVGYYAWGKGKPNERTGYPTQKPLTLYERIIRASSNEGDFVLDPFCGCATTPVAAERLGRQWVGMDIWDGAKDIVLQRLQDNWLFTPEAAEHKMFPHVVQVETSRHTSARTTTKSPRPRSGCASGGRSSPGRRSAIAA